MGYTHYWRCDPKKLVQHLWYKEVLEDMAKIVEANKDLLAGWDGDVFTDILASTRDGISFNGIGPNSCETFNFPPLRDFDFCKTRGMPYDVVVTACLAAAKDRLGDAIKVSSDGRHDEWTDGVELASKVLGRLILNPIPC
jgi:hypothetical protein